MSERVRNPPPDNWPTGLPAPTSPELPYAAMKWLWDVLPEDRWRQPVLRAEPWLLAMMATATIDHQIRGLRESYKRTIEHYRGVLDPDTMAALIAAHVAEADRLLALRRQAEAVDQALFQGGAKRYH